MSGSTRTALYRFALILMFLTTSACAKLQVEVSVLSPAVVEAEVDRILIRDRFPHVRARMPEDVSALVEQVKNTHFQSYVALAEAYRQQKSGIADPNIQDVLESLAKDLDDGPGWGDWYAEKEKLLNALYQKARQEAEAFEKARDPESGASALLAATLRTIAATESDISDRVKEDIDSLGNSDENREKALTELRSELSAPTRDVSDTAQGKGLINSLAAAEGAAAVTAAATAARAAAAKVLFDPKGIADSPYLHAVVSAPKKQWAKRYDYSRGRGIFGNTDIAIKALGPGNFTVKGLSFNPADVAQTAAKVVAQAVVLAAQMYGVPISMPAPAKATSSAPRPDESTKPDQGEASGSEKPSGITDSLVRANQDKSAVLSHRDAMLALAEAITAESDAISGTAAQRAEAVKAIRATYSAQEPRLLTK